MDLARYFSTRRKENLPSRDATPRRAHLPLIASPVNKDVLEIMSSGGSLNLEKISSGSTTTGGTHRTLANSKTSSGNLIIYKRHHEAHTIELLYDLFFVANLAYFTAVHQHVDADCEST